MLSPVTSPVVVHDSENADDAPLHKGNMPRHVALIRGSSGITLLYQLLIGFSF